MDKSLLFLSAYFLYINREYERVIKIEALSNALFTTINLIDPAATSQLVEGSNTTSHTYKPIYFYLPTTIRAGFSLLHYHKWPIKNITGPRLIRGRKTRISC